jgi:hypothetical protein
MARVRLAEDIAAMEAAGAGVAVQLATAVSRTAAAASPRRLTWTRFRRFARVSSDDEPDRVTALRLAR